MAHRDELDRLLREGGDAPLPPPALGPPRRGEPGYISPDEPVVRQSPPSPPEDFEEVMSRPRPPWERPELGEATGVGEEHYPDLKLLKRFYGDANLARLVQAVVRLASALEQRGEAGLRTTPDMTRFEATLRAYCVGYLGGLRERASGPEDDEPSLHE